LHDKLCPVSAAKKERVRDRRRVEAKRSIQAVALDLFEELGFASVTMEQIAAAAEVGVATVYRYFGTKERVVSWDEYDPLLLDKIDGRIAPNATLDAVRTAIGESLETFYAADSGRILRRARLVAQTPALQVAALHELAALRAGLLRVLTRRGSAMPRLAAEVAAGATVACLQAAIDAWVRARGRPRLGELIDEAFGELRALSHARAKRRSPRSQRRARRP
jgi:AcrR family transcriptional regulator